MAGRCLVGYVWMSEHLVQSHVPGATAFFFGIDSSCIFLTALYFKYVSQDWHLIYGLPLVVLLVAIMCLYWSDDTPKFYYGTKQYDECRRVLTNIGRLNGVLGPEESFKEKFEEEVNPKDTQEERQEGDFQSGKNM